MMKKLLLPLCLCLLLTGCVQEAPPAQVAATTLPVYEFTARLCQGTDITVTRLVTESVSCLHDYSLPVSQLRAAKGAQALVLSGAGLEDFMADVLDGAACVIDASQGVSLLPSQDGGDDPHIWLSPVRAKIMARNICQGLSGKFPDYADEFEGNLSGLLSDLDELQAYGEERLSGLSCRELITFHDGFAYFADAFGLTVLEAVEEESGSEAAASDLVRLIRTAQTHDLPALFTERNGSDAAAKIIAAETGIPVYALDMAMAGDSYFDAMYHNIDTIWEACT